MRRTTGKAVMREQTWFAISDRENQKPAPTLRRTETPSAPLICRLLKRHLGLRKVNLFTMCAVRKTLNRRM